MRARQEFSSCCPRFICMQPFPPPLPFSRGPKAAHTSHSQIGRSFSLFVCVLPDLHNKFLFSLSFLLLSFPHAYGLPNSPRIGYLSGASLISLFPFRRGDDRQKGIRRQSLPPFLPPLETTDQNPQRGLEERTVLPFPFSYPLCPRH